MKSKRKMPAHIVLPNGMWRFVKGKAKASIKTRARSKRSAIRMVRHRKGSYGVSKGGIMSGIIKPHGLIASALIGAGAATLIENTGFKPLGDMTGLAAGFAVGGIGGAAGAFARNAIKGQLGGSGSYASGY